MQSVFITSWLFPHSLQDLINQCPQSSEIFKKIKDLEADIEFYKKEKEKLEQTLHTEHEMRLINDETKTRKLEQQSRLRAEAEAKWLEEVKKKQPWLIPEQQLERVQLWR